MSVINLSQNLLVSVDVGSCDLLFEVWNALLKCIGAACRPVTQRSRFVQLVVYAGATLVLHLKPALCLVLLA